VRAESLRFVVDGEISGLERAGDWLFSREWLDEYEAELRARAAAADPIDPGIPLPAEAWAPEVVPLLSLERRGSRLYLPGSSPSLAGREREAVALERELAQAGVRATKVEDDELARYLEAREKLVRLGDGYAIGADAFEVALDVLLTECRSAGAITLARFRDLLGVGRRDAQLLLERMDADGVTRRDGEARVLRRAAARSR
jgi:selenocysteine-specific elongation factor